MNDLPGDRRPASKRLDRPPGDRYASPAGAQGTGPNRGTGPNAATGPNAGTGPNPGAAAAATSRPKERAAAGFLGRPSLARAILLAMIAAVVALAVYFVLAGPLSITAPLVLVAIIAGRAIGLAVRSGSGRLIGPGRSILIALLVTAGWFVAAQVAVWQFALSEGGDLAVIDYLAQVFGLVVPLVLIAALLAAWWSARWSPR